MGTNNYQFFSAVRNQKKLDRVRALEEIFTNNPNEKESKLIAIKEYISLSNSKAGEINEYYRGKSRELLNELLIDHKDNAVVLHYLVHAWEDTKFALDKTEEYLQTFMSSAPNSPHLSHMPAHIYFRSGNYSYSVYQFVQSFKVDTWYLKQYVCILRRIFVFLELSIVSARI